MVYFHNSNIANILLIFDNIATHLLGVDANKVYLKSNEVTFWQRQLVADFKKESRGCFYLKGKTIIIIIIKTVIGVSQLATGVLWYFHNSYIWCWWVGGEYEIEIETTIYHLERVVSGTRTVCRPPVLGTVNNMLWWEVNLIFRQNHGELLLPTPGRRLTLILVEKAKI